MENLLHTCTITLIIIVPRKALAVSLLQFGGVVGKLVVGNLSTLLIQRELTKVTFLQICTTYFPGVHNFVCREQVFSVSLCHWWHCWCLCLVLKASRIKVR